MPKKMWMVVLVVALALGAVGMASADEGDGSNIICDDDLGICVPAIMDGRINAFDLTEPVAIYYDHATVPTWNLVEGEDGEEAWEQSSTEAISGISVWAIDANGVGQEALYIPLSTIEAAVASGSDTVLVEANGISVGYSADGWFWLTAPGYSYSWAMWN